MSNEALRPAVDADARVVKLEVPDPPAASSYSFSFA